MIDQILIEYTVLITIISLVTASSEHININAFVVNTYKQLLTLVANQLMKEEKNVEVKSKS